MPRYRYVGIGAFRDGARGRHIAEGEVVDLPDAVADAHPDEFVAVDTDDGDDHDRGGDGDEASGADAGVDDDRLDDASYDELRAVAAEAEADAIDGRSSADEIRDHLRDHGLPDSVEFADD